MGTKEMILQAIASCPGPASEPAKQVLEKQRATVLHDLDVAASRAAELGIPITEVIKTIAPHYEDTHICFLDEASGD